MTDDISSFLLGVIIASLGMLVVVFCSDRTIMRATSAYIVYSNEDNKVDTLTFENSQILFDASDITFEYQNSETIISSNKILELKLVK